MEIWFKRKKNVCLNTSIHKKAPFVINGKNIIYNKARVLALYKSYWAAMNKFFTYARACVNKDFVHDDVFSCVFRLFS